MAGQGGSAGRVGVAQDQNLTGHTAAAQVQRLGQAAYREPLGTCVRQRAADDAVAVAVGTGLDHRAHGGGPGVLLQQSEIMGQCVQIHLSPAMFFEIQTKTPRCYRVERG